MNEVNPPRIPRGVMILCVLLLVAHPVLFALSGTGALSALSVRGWPLAALLFVRLAVTAFGIAAGLVLLQLRPAAFGITLVSLALSAATDIFARVTSFIPMNRVPGDAPFYVLVSLAYYGGWMLYLTRSDKVRRALRPDPPL